MVKLQVYGVDIGLSKFARCNAAGSDGRNVKGSERIQHAELRNKLDETERRNLRRNHHDRKDEAEGELAVARIDGKEIFSRPRGFRVETDLEGKEIHGAINL